MGMSYEDRVAAQRKLDAINESSLSETEKRKARRTLYRQSGGFAADLAEGGAALAKGGCALMIVIPLFLILVVVILGMLFGDS